MIACVCNNTLGNTGNDCIPVMEVANFFIAVPLKDSTGARNGIPLNTVFSQTYFDGMINQTDPTKRWYPMLPMKNVTDERGDSIKETFEDNSTQLVQQGVRAVNALISEGDGANQVILGKYQTFSCEEFGLYTVTITGDLIGTLGNSQDVCNPTTLYPVSVDKGSWDPKLRKKTNTTGQAIALMFNWKQIEQDENLRTITAAEAGYDLTLLEGLNDVCAVFSDIQEDEFTVQLRVTGFGNLTAPLTLDGLEIGDFALYNVTDAAVVSIIAVTESPDGTYNITYATQTIGDILRLTPTETGYDFTAVIAEEIEIPAT